MVGSKSTPEPAGRALIIELRSLLGPRLVAYLGETDTYAVREWANGTSSLPARTILDRLHLALEAAQLLTKRDSPAVAQIWFQGRNPALGDRPPAKVLRDADLAHMRDLVLAAARELVAYGA